MPRTFMVSMKRIKYKYEYENGVDFDLTVENGGNYKPPNLLERSFKL